MRISPGTIVGSQGTCLLHVISRKKLLEAADAHGDLAAALDFWYRIAKSSGWNSLEDVRIQLPKTDGVGEYTVFNIKGNAYRLISKINYKTKTLFILHVLTHAEYEKGRWNK